MNHSVDAYILRCIHRRCNYVADEVLLAREYLEYALTVKTDNDAADRAIRYYSDLYNRSGMADMVILPHLTKHNVRALDEQHIKDLLAIIETMLAHKPFEVVTVHDEFKCHPNYMNHLRQHYINVFAELAESRVLEMILSGIYGKPGKYKKLSTDLGDLIRESNYALC